MTRALVWMRKGKAHQKQARDALVVASRSRPDIISVGDMILNLDIALDDGESAERHARRYRHCHCIDLHAVHYTIFRVQKPNHQHRPQTAATAAQAI